MGLSRPMPWESMPLLSDSISTSATIAASAAGTPAATRASFMKFSRNPKSSQTQSL